MRALTHLGALLFVMAGCDRSHPAVRDSAHAGNADPYSGIVETRADWEDFEKRLPRDSVAAAAALERYRQSLGLPFDFSIDASPGREAVAKHLHVVDDEMGSGAYVTAFVQRMPDAHSVLGTSPVMEFDSTGHVIRRWAIPRDVDFWYVVEGAVGDELITAYRTVRANVHLRFKPDGTYRVSAEPPPPLEKELWLEVADSTWLRVRPPGGIQHALHATEVPVGHWVPRGDSGWYVRTDTVPGMKTDAHVMTLPQEPQPHFIECPNSPEVQGMSCSAFPGEHGIRRLAYPTPMS